MKKYIGIKEINAEPMTKGEAFKAGLLRSATLQNHEHDIYGYKITQNNGYSTWMPADVFEAIYKVADTALDRLNIEIEEVRKRCGKLENFIFHQNEGKDFQVLPLGMRAFLLSQYHIMISYHTLMSLRETGMVKDCKCCPCALSFEQALPMIREGFAMRRSDWKENLFVVRQIPAHINTDVVPKIQSLPDEAKRLLLAGPGCIDYTCQCLIIDKETGRADSWMPTIADVFAYDWELVKE